MGRRGRVAIAIAVTLFAAAGAVLWFVWRDETETPPSPISDAPAETEKPAAPPRVRDPGPPKPPAPRSVRVAVTSMEGKPIAGARIELVPGPKDDFNRQFVPHAKDPPRGRTVTCDEDGRATLDDVPPGRWFVVAEAPGFARHALAGLVREGDEAVETTVALADGHTFAGTVRDPDGAPAAGVTVILVPRATFVTDGTCLRTTTAKDGSYRFEGVDAGAHTLWYVPHADVCLLEASVLVPQIDGLDIRMARGATVEGTVRDADTGGAVAGARVLAFSYARWEMSGFRGLMLPLGTGATDELGRFSMRTWRRTTAVSCLLVDADGYVAEPVDGEGRLDIKGAEEGQRFVADLRIRRAGALRGTVSVAGKPFAGAQVRVQPEDDRMDHPLDDRSWSAVTVSDGGFRVARLPAGPATITVCGDRPFEVFTGGVTFDVEAGRDTECDVKLEPRRLRVTRRVAAEGEVPVPWAGADVVQRIGPLSAAARTDADGRFTIDAWFFGDCAPVELRRGAFVQGACIDADGEDGTDLSPRPPAADAAKGTVLDGDDAPAAGVRVEITAGMESAHEAAIAWRGVRETVSGPDGTFRVPAFSGPEFSAWAAGTPWAYKVREKDGSLSIQLPEAFRFDGRVVASDTGDAIARALVFDDDYNLMTRTDGEGRFVVEGPTRALSGICVVSDGRLDETDDPEPDAWVITMRPALSLAGVVRRADGSPVRGAFVRVTGSYRGAELTTDHDGRFIASGMDAGPCEIEVSDPRRCTILPSRVVAQAGTRDVTVVVRDGVCVVVLVTDAEGTPLWSADVTVRRESPEREDVPLTRFALGEFAFAAVPDSSYTIRAELEGCTPVERRGVRAGEEPVKIVLTPDKVVVGDEPPVPPAPAPTDDR